MGLYDGCNCDGCQARYPWNFHTKPKKTKKANKKGKKP